MLFRSGRGPATRPSPSTGVCAICRACSAPASIPATAPTSISARGNGRGARPHLAGLIVDRLRERRGVDASARPDEARRILGEELWGVVAGTAPAPRSAEELSTLIERIHEL